MFLFGPALETALNFANDLNYYKFDKYTLSHSKETVCVNHFVVPTKEVN